MLLKNRRSIIHKGLLIVLAFLVIISVFMIPTPSSATSFSATTQDVNDNSLTINTSGDHVYHLPFPIDDTYNCSRSNGIMSHNGLQFYAFDFLMPVGSIVVAAREGVIKDVVQDQDEDGTGDGNYVLIDHTDDDSSAIYLHLRKNGALVQKGQTVQEGQPIALSGRTGKGAGLYPHLHFQVQADGGAWTQSRQIFFTYSKIVNGVSVPVSKGIPQSGEDCKSTNLPPCYRIGNRVMTIGENNTGVLKYPNEPSSLIISVAPGNFGTVTEETQYIGNSAWVKVKYDASNFQYEGWSNQKWLSIVPNALISEVSSKTGWQQTSLYVFAHTPFYVNYKSGGWTVDYRLFPYVGPEGYTSEIDNQVARGYKYVEDLPYATLIGKVGDSSMVITITDLGGPFYAENNGLLSLRINDKDIALGDNDGSIEVILGSVTGTNLVLSKKAPSSLNHGDTITYTFFYNNIGNSSAHNTAIEDTLPGNLTFVSASDGGVYTPSTRKITWDLGTVAAFPKGKGSRTLTATIPQDVPVGTVISNTASISTSNNETETGDNTAKASTKITGSNLPANVGLGPIVGTTGGVPSVYYLTPTVFTYYNAGVTSVGIRIHVLDGGPDITANMMGGPPNWSYSITLYPRHGETTVTYTPNGLSPVSFNIYIDPAGYIYDTVTGLRISGANVWLQRPDGTGSWENVPTGQTPAVMQPDVNPLITGDDGQYQWDVLEGTYRIHVEAVGYIVSDSIIVSVPPPVTDLNVGLIPNSVDLVVTKSANVDQIFAGNDIKYTITVTNKGPSDASGVLVNENLPTGVKYKSSNTHQKGTYNSGVWNIGDLYVNETAVLTLEANLNSNVRPGIITNIASVSCDQTDIDLSNNSASQSLTVIAAVPILTNLGIMVLVILFGLALIIGMVWQKSKHTGNIK